MSVTACSTPAPTEDTALTRSTRFVLICVVVVLILAKALGRPRQWGLPEFTMNNLQLDAQGNYPPARVGEAVRRPSLIHGGHEGCRRFEVVSGSLPPGIEIDPDSGAFTGIPTTPGVYSFQIEATDRKAGPREDRLFNVEWEVRP